MVVVAVAVIAAAIGGTAVAADSSSSNSFLDDFAQHLGVSPSKVQSAYQATVTDRLNALVKAGKLTQQQANAIEQHMKNDHGGPLMGGFGFGIAPHAAFGFHGGGFFGHHGGAHGRRPVRPAPGRGQLPGRLRADARIRSPLRQDAGERRDGAEEVGRRARGGDAGGRDASSSTRRSRPGI